MRVKEGHPSAENPRVPGEIRGKLHHLARRRQVLRLLRGGLLTAAAGGAALLSAMVVDYFADVSDGVWRYGLSLAALGLTLLVFVLFLLRPLMELLAGSGRRPLVRWALELERRHPELQERISSSIELLSSRDAPAVRGSAALIEALAGEARKDARRIRPHREVKLSALRRAAAATSLVAAVLLGVWLTWPVQTTRLAQRAVWPMRDLPQIYSGRISVTPGNAVFLEGQPLAVAAGVEGIAGKAQILLKADGSPQDRAFPMASAGEGAFRYEGEPLFRSLSYRIRVGRATSETYKVTVLPPPAVAGITVSYTPPAYTHLPAQRHEGSSGTLQGLRGGLCEITLRLNRPCELAAKLSDVALPADRVNDTVYRLKIPLAKSGWWNARLSDAYGFSAETPRFDVEVAADQPPVAAILSPEETIHAGVDDVIPVRYAVSDDIALSAAELRLWVDGKPLPSRPLPVASGGTVNVDLSELELEASQKVTYQIFVRDNLPAELGGPQEGRSAEHVLRLDAPQGYVSSTQQEREQKIRRQVEQALELLRTSRQDAQGLCQTLPQLVSLDRETLQQIDRCHETLLAADDHLHQALDLLKGSPWAALAGALDSIRQENLFRAIRLSGGLKSTDDSSERVDGAEQTKLAIDKAIERLEAWLVSLDAQARLANRAQRLDDLARRQQRLADNAPASRPAASSYSDDRWVREQQRVADQLAQLLQQTSQAWRRQMQQQGKDAENLAKRARQLQQEQQEIAAETERLRQLQQIEEQLGELSAQQADIARHGATLRDALGTQSPEAGRLAAAAAEAANQAARNNDAPDMAHLAQQQSARQFEALAANLGKPLAVSDLSKQAAALAHRQHQLRQRLRQYRNRAASTQPSQAAIARSGPQPASAPSSAPASAPSAEKEWAAIVIEQQDIQAQVRQLAGSATPATPGAAGAIRANNPEVNLSQAINALQQENLDQAETAQAAAEAQLAEMSQQIARAGTMSPQQSAALEGRRAEAQSLGLQQQQVIAQQEQLSRRRQQLAQGLQRDQSARLQAQQQQLASTTQGPNASSPELAQRQQSLGRQMQALSQGNFAGVLQEQQLSAQSQTERLSQGVSQLQGQAQQMPPDAASAEAAQKAAQAFGQAQQQQQLSAQQLAQRQPNQALPAQKQAAKQLEQAANALMQMRQMAAKKADQPEEAPGSPNSLSGAQEDLLAAEASAALAVRGHSGAAARKAAVMLSSAARDARLQADSAGLTSPSANAAAQNTPVGQGKPGRGGTARAAMANPAVNEDGAGGDWAHLAGELRDQAVQADDPNIPEEYRSIIKEYFRDVSRLAQQGPATPDAAQQGGAK